MAKKDTEYLYLTSRIRASEGGKSYSEKLSSYLACRSIDALYDVLFGEEKRTDKTKKECIEEYADNKIGKAFDFVRSIAPEKNLFDFLLYEYDCCNLKTLIKCAITNTSADGILYSYRSVATDKLKEAVENGNFDCLPENMKKAAPSAISEYAKTKNPQIIDITLDKACFADMLENAKKSGCPLAEKLVVTRIDMINTVTFARIKKSDIFDKSAYFSSVFIDGGEMSVSAYSNAFNTEDALSEILSGTRYKSVISHVEKNDFVSLEKAFEEIYLGMAKDVRFIPFGAEVAIAYLVNTVAEAKNIRIILAGIYSGLDAETIRERVRFGYV